MCTWRELRCFGSSEHERVFQGQSVRGLESILAAGGVVGVLLSASCAPAVDMDANGEGVDATR